MEGIAKKKFEPARVEARAVSIDTIPNGIDQRYGINPTELSYALVAGQVAGSDSLPDAEAIVEIIPKHHRVWGVPVALPEPYAHLSYLCVKGSVGWVVHEELLEAQGNDQRRRVSLKIADWAYQKARDGTISSEKILGLADLQNCWADHANQTLEGYGIRTHASVGVVILNELVCDGYHVPVSELQRGVPYVLPNGKIIDPLPPGFIPAQQIILRPTPFRVQDLSEFLETAHGQIADGEQVNPDYVLDHARSVLASEYRGEEYESMKAEVRAALEAIGYDFTNRVVPANVQDTVYARHRLAATVAELEPGAGLDEHKLPMSVYLAWFSITLGRNIGRLHGRARRMSRYMTPGNVTLDCRLIDRDSIAPFNVSLQAGMTGISRTDDIETLSRMIECEAGASRTAQYHVNTSGAYVINELHQKVLKNFYTDFLPRETMLELYRRAYLKEVGDLCDDKGNVRREVIAGYLEEERAK